MGLWSSAKNFVSKAKKTVKKIGKKVTKSQLTRFMVTTSFGAGTPVKSKFSQKTVGGIEEGISLLGKKMSGIQAKEEAQRANKQMKRAADEAQDQYDAQTKKAEKAADLLKSDEEERKRRLALKGTQKPQTLLGSYLGVSSRGRSYLG